MADEPIYKSGDDEYSYSTTSTPSVDAFGAKESNSLGSGFSALLGRLVVVAVVAFMGFAAYKLYGHYTLAKNNRVAPPAPPMITAPQPIPAPVAETAPVAPVAPVVANDMTTRLATLETQSSTTTTEVQTLQTGMTAMQNDLNAMKTNMEAMNQTLQQLSAQLAKPIAKRAVPARKPVKQHAATPVVARTVYAVQAVIPGRAWLIAEDGSTLTVAEGDTLRGYGSIRQIDPVKGRVYTSSGYTIRVNLN